LIGASLRTSQRSEEIRRSATEQRRKRELRESTQRYINLLQSD